MLGQHNCYLQNWGGYEMAWWAKVLTTEPAGLRSTTGIYTVEGENQILQVVFWPSHVCRGTHDLAKPSAHTGECSLGENKLSKQKLFENGCCRWIHTSADANMAERYTNKCAQLFYSLTLFGVAYPPQNDFLYRCKKRWPSAFCMPPWWSQWHMLDVRWDSTTHRTSNTLFC